VALTNEYKAGLFDGEGYVGIYLKKRSHNIRVVIGLTDPRPLAFLHAEYGGSLWTKHYDNPNHRPFTSWYLTGSKVIQFLMDVQPFLVVKAEQVALALEFRSMQTGRQVRKISEETFGVHEDYRQRLMALKHLRT